jgi:alkanesulfonate monooxygenase SsuD/methylene tetrahydromethanopterin reductase-like flavin-dependent oxidoreductase (luciferase family)
MQIGYMLDTSFGGMRERAPTREAAASAISGLMAEAHEAEAAGFRVLAVPERHMRTDCVVPDSLSLLAALATQTEHIGLGTYASVVTLHNPMQFAETVAFLDLISRGRIFVTAARGFQGDYWRMMGIEPRHMTTRFLESIEILQLAWAGARFSFSGELMSFEDVVLTPGPWQRPGGPPIWGGGHSAAAIRRAAEFASAWAGGFFPIDRRKWDHHVGAYRRSATQLGKPSAVVLVRAGFVAASLRRAEAIVGDSITDELTYYQQHPGIEAAYALDRSEMTGLLPHLVLGSPDDCIAALRRYEADYGVDLVIMRFRMPSGPSLEETIAAIRLFGSDVLPFVQGKSDERPAFLPSGAF